MTTYIAQKRRDENSNWITVKTRTFRIGGTAQDAAWDLNDEMQLMGFRCSELHLHREDLANGDILTADDGRQIRVIKDEDAPTYPLNAEARKHALHIADETVRLAGEVQEKYDAGLIPWGAYNDLNVAIDYFNQAVLAVADKGREVVYKEQG